MFRFKNLLVQDGEFWKKYRVCSNVKAYVSVHSYSPDKLSATQNCQVAAESFSTLLDFDPCCLHHFNETQALISVLSIWIVKYSKLESFFASCAFILN